MNTKTIFSRATFVALLLSTFSLLSQNNEQNFQKLSLSYTQALTDMYIKYRTQGVELEYYKNLDKRIGFSVNLETDRFNNIPKNPEIYKDIEGTSHIDDLIKYKTDFIFNENINQNIFSAHFYFNPINNKKNLLYLSNGLGYNIQDITYQWVIEDTYTYTTGKIVKYKFDYFTKHTNTLVYLVALGYDYNIKNNILLGLNIRGQLPLVRDKYFWELNRGAGGGYDELIRVGLKVGKRF